MERKLFLFDCFGVVVADVSTLWMNKRLTADEQLYMRKNVFRKVDVGQMTMDGMFAAVSALYGLDEETVRHEWRECEDVHADTLHVITELRKQGHCVALLSNAAEDYVDYLFDKFDLHKYFDYKFVSSAYGTAKPDREFYELCLKHFCGQYKKIYFTDDNPANLSGLEQLGITPVLFTSTADFAKAVGLKI